MNHKYGFHVNRTGSDVLDAIRRIRPSVIKVLDHNVGFCKEIRAIVPDVMLIGRLVITPQEQDEFMDDPGGKGQAFAQRILSLEANKASVQGRPLFDAWESYNEVLAGHAPDDLKRAYDDFQVAFAAPIKQAGFEPIAMNFGTGNMLGRDFLELFPGTLETYTYLGFHEYDWPDMWRLHRQNIEEKEEEGMWLTLRYRRIMRDVRQVHGDRHKVIVTECGMTQGVIEGEDVGPWHPPTLPPHLFQTLKDKLDIQAGVGISEERYWQSLVWYNGELMNDDYVLAALLFVVGAISPWKSFEHLGSIINRLEVFQDAGTTQPGGTGTTEPDDNGPGGQGTETSLGTALLAEAARAQVIQFNPAAALQKRIFADGFVPNSPEFEIEHGGVRYVAQRAEHLASGEVRVYHVRKGDWAHVAFVRRGEDGIFPV
jgi:hypothetical protein